MSGLSCPGPNLLGLLDDDEIMDNDEIMDTDEIMDNDEVMDKDEIMALCDTITNHLVQPEDHQDAIRAIFVYSQL